MQDGFMLTRMTLAGLLGLASIAGVIAQADAADDRAVTIGEGKITFTSPEGWEKKQPRIRIIEAEFAAPPAKGDEQPGRLTVMGAGGSVEANIDRWIAQFDQPDGGDTKKAAKIEKLRVNGQNVHYVDVSGTYHDMPGGPFAGGKPVLRDDYRMLAAIIETEKAGNYFFKFYGPKATVAENEKAFRGLVDSLKVQ
jgi:hypothetical protein